MKTGRCFLAALALGATAPAQADTLETDTIGGHIRFDVTGTGSILSGFFDPTGPEGDVRILSPSDMYLGFGGGGDRIHLGAIVPTSSSGNALERTSSFSVGGIDFSLTQSLSPFFGSDGAQLGTQLRQVYSFTNTSGAEQGLDFVRFLDPDLNFLNGEEGFDDNGGGTIGHGGTTASFATQIPTAGPGEETPFVGLYANGGRSLGHAVYFYEELERQVFHGEGLTNIVSRDGDGDNWADIRLLEGEPTGEDLGIAQGNQFRLAANETGRFAATTLFGFGAPADVVIGAVPEPATWLMMILGFMGAGLGLRRGKRRALVPTRA